MSTLLKYIGLSLLALIVGFKVSTYVLNSSFSYITSARGHIILLDGVNSLFKARALFALLFGSFPWLYFLWRKLTKETFRNKGLITCSIILGVGILFWLIRLFQLQYRFKNLENFNKGYDPLPSISIGALHLPEYAFFGFLIGTLVSILIYRKTS